jgi:hypothetical protein
VFQRGVFSPAHPQVGYPRSGPEVGDDPSRFPSTQKHGDPAEGADLEALVKVWPCLSPELRKAVLALVLAALGEG